MIANVVALFASLADKSYYIFGDFSARSPIPSAIIKILSEAQQELFKELTPEQREKAERALGEPFRFRDDEYLGMSLDRYKD